jgi:hypothetical protein
MSAGIALSVSALVINAHRAEGSLLRPAFERSDATEMNGANAQQFSRAANDMFGEYSLNRLEIRTGLYVVVGITKPAKKRPSR